MAELAGEWAYRVQHVGDVVTYIDPNMHVYETEYPSDGPFDLIDTRDNQERVNYGERIRDLILESYKAHEKLFMEMWRADGLIHVDLQSISNVNGDYGYLSWYSMAIFCASALSDEKVTMSFRTKREAMTFLLNLMLRIIEKLPEDQRPDSWERIVSCHGLEVNMCRKEREVEYRLAALALRLMNDARWSDVRDSDDELFDGCGKVSVPADGEEADELLLGSGGRCVCCGRDKSEMNHFVQLNQYARLCDRCVSDAAEIFAQGSDAVAAHGFKSVTAKHLERMRQYYDRQK